MGFAYLVRNKNCQHIDEDDCECKSAFYESMGTWHSYCAWIAWFLASMRKVIKEYNDKYPERKHELVPELCECENCKDFDSVNGLRFCDSFIPIGQCKRLLRALEKVSKFAGETYKHEMVTAMTAFRIAIEQGTKVIIL